MIERNSPATRCAVLASQVAAGASRILRELGAELARLNRTGLSADAHEDRSRRARAQLVTAALSHRHDGRNRCC